MPANRRDSLDIWAWSAYPARAASKAKEVVWRPSRNARWKRRTRSRVFGPYPTLRQQRLYNRRSPTDSALLALWTAPIAVGSCRSRSTRASTIASDGLAPPARSATARSRTWAAASGPQPRPVLRPGGPRPPHPRGPPGRCAGPAAPKQAAPGNSALFPAGTEHRQMPSRGLPLREPGQCPGRRRTARRRPR